MCAQDVEAILTMLTTELKISASTQNQAISTLLFLYREVLGINLPWRDGVSRPAQKSRISNVLTKEDVAALLQFLDLDMQLLAQLLYAMGAQLRIQDVDFGRHVIIVREAKGRHDRQAQRAGQSVGRNGFRRMADRFVADSLISLLTGNHPVSTRGQTEPLPYSRS